MVQHVGVLASRLGGRDPPPTARGAWRPVPKPCTHPYNVPGHPLRAVACWGALPLGVGTPCGVLGRLCSVVFAPQRAPPRPRLVSHAPMYQCHGAAIRAPFGQHWARPRPCPPKNHNWPGGFRHVEIAPDPGRPRQAYRCIALDQARAAHPRSCQSDKVDLCYGRERLGGVPTTTRGRGGRGERMLMLPPVCPHVLGVVA